MSEMLAEAAGIGGVTLLAIVDDAYDPPRGDEISEDAFNRFVLSLEDDPPRLVALSQASELVDADLDDWETFTGKSALLSRLWNLSVGVVAEPAITDAVAESLEMLFSDVSQDRMSKLQQLRPLEKLLATTNTQLLTLGADPDTSIVAEA